MPNDGATVSYVGDPGPERPAIGDVGTVLSGERTSAYVQWRTGSLAGQVQVYAADDLATRADLAPTPDEFTVSARAMVDVGGERALVEALAEDGHFAALSGAADQAITSLASEVRQDPYLASVLAGLDQDEGDLVTSLAVAAVLRERLTG